MDNEELSEIIKNANGNLDLHGQKLTAENIQLITKALTENATITTLNLSECNLEKLNSLTDRKIMKQFAAAIGKSTTLTSLDLSDNNFPSKVVASLLNGVASNHSLKTFNFSKNVVNFGDSDGSRDEIERALNKLFKNTIIEHLELPNVKSYMGRENWLALLANKSLKSCHFSFNLHSDVSSFTQPLLFAVNELDAQRVNPGLANISVDFIDAENNVKQFCSLILATKGFTETIQTVTPENEFENFLLLCKYQSLENSNLLQISSYINSDASYRLKDTIATNIEQFYSYLAIHHPKVVDGISKHSSYLMNVIREYLEEQALANYDLDKYVEIRMAANQPLNNSDLANFLFSNVKPPKNAQLALAVSPSQERDLASLYAKKLYEYQNNKSYDGPKFEIFSNQELNYGMINSKRLCQEALERLEHIEKQGNQLKTEVNQLREKLVAALPNEPNLSQRIGNMPLDDLEKFINQHQQTLGPDNQNTLLQECYGLHLKDKELNGDLAIVNNNVAAMFPEFFKDEKKPQAVEIKEQLHAMSTVWSCLAAIDSSVLTQSEVNLLGNNPVFRRALHLPLCGEPIVMARDQILDNPATLKSNPGASKAFDGDAIKQFAEQVEKRAATPANLETADKIAAQFFNGDIEIEIRDVEKPLTADKPAELTNLDLKELAASRHHRQKVAEVRRVLEGQSPDRPYDDTSYKK